MQLLHADLRAPQRREPSRAPCKAGAARFRQVARVGCAGAHRVQVAVVQVQQVARVQSAEILERFLTCRELLIWGGTDRICARTRLNKEVRNQTVGIDGMALCLV